MKKPIGRIIATEKVPTTMDKFTFWTDSDLKLHAFDIVKVSPNDFKDDSDGEKERVYQEYKDLGLSTEPFKKVKYFIPYSSNSSAKQSTYLPNGLQIDTKIIRVKIVIWQMSGGQNSVHFLPKN